MLLDRVERLWPSCEPICFEEAPSAGGAGVFFSPLLMPAVTAWISNTFLSPYYLRSQVPHTVRSPNCLLYLSSG